MPRGVPKAGFRNTNKRLAQAKEASLIKAKESRFGINDRFTFVEDMIGLLATNIQPSVIITGPGGLGKSFTVAKALKDNGLKDISLLDDGFEVGAVLGPKTFRVVKGYSTPKGLYRTLYENRSGVIVFDDCDSVLRDDTALNLLKGALDSYERRIISWKAEKMDDDLPSVFEFKGRVIFISNMPRERIDQAILTRSMVVDLTMTTVQKIERMRTMLKDPTFLTEIERPIKDRAMDLIEDLQDRIEDLSLRTLITVSKIAKKGGPRWKDLAEYAIC